MRELVAAGHEVTVETHAGVGIGMDDNEYKAAGARILTPLTDGTLGSVQAPWSGMIAVDGNLTEGLLAAIADDPAFAAADLRLAPASPGKAERLRAAADAAPVLSAAPSAIGEEASGAADR